MSDNPPPEPAPPDEVGNPTTVTNISGGIYIDTPRDVIIGGDAVGRDKITSVNTAGGAHVEGDVNTAEFVGRDKITYTIVPRDKNLSILMEKVKTFWVKGVLENSVHHAALIELGKQVRTDAVEADHPWETIMRAADKPDRTLPPQAKIIDVFDEMQGALLILGEPGSGKTTTLLELARDLIVRSEKDFARPVPVYFNLSSWWEKPQPQRKKRRPQIEEQQTIAEWLIDELRAKYGASSKIGRQWVENNDLIVLLDGLDEVKAEHRRACVEAINAFRAECGFTGIVVCSRTTEYEELAKQLKLNGAVVVQPLTSEQVDRYLVAGGSGLAVLESAMRTDAVLQELAEVPLMLSIMSLAYSGQAVDAIEPSLDDRAQAYKHLFNAYVGKMFTRDGRTVYKPYPKDKTIRWLAWLAAKMSEHGQSVFLIERMQPGWLQLDAQRRRLKIASFLVFGTAFGLIGVLALGITFGLAFGLVVGPVIGLVSGLFFGTNISADNGQDVGLGSKQSISPLSDIESVESLTWAWSNLIKWLGHMLVMGLAVGLFALLFFGLVCGLNRGLVTGVSCGVMAVLFLALIIGLDVKQMELKTKPNQGIWLSGRNALMMGLVGGLFVGLVSGLGIGLLSGSVGGPCVGLGRGLLDGPGRPGVVLKGIVVMGLIGMVTFGLLGGGIAFIRHFVLRFVLYRNSDMPWNYVRFLDYAAERIFLRKVGGGYIFIHRMLMEYFAELETQPNAQSDK